MFLRRIIHVLISALCDSYTEMPLWRQLTAILLAGAIGSTSSAAMPTLSHQLLSPASNRELQTKTETSSPHATTISLPSISSDARPAPNQLASLGHILPRIHAYTNPPSGTSTISSNFNGTAIPAGDYIWFNAAFKVSGMGSSGTTIYVQGQTIQFTVGATAYSVAVPNSKVVLSPQVTTATTVFDAVQNLWVTSLPLQFSGNGIPRRSRLSRSCRRLARRDQSRELDRDVLDNNSGHFS